MGCCCPVKIAIVCATSTRVNPLCFFSPSVLREFWSQHPAGLENPLAYALSILAFRVWVCIASSVGTLKALSRAICARTTDNVNLIDMRRTPAAVHRRPRSEVTTLFRVCSNNTEYGSARCRGAPKSPVDEFIVATVTSLMRATWAASWGCQPISSSPGTGGYLPVSMASTFTTSGRSMTCWLKPARFDKYPDGSRMFR